MRKIIILALFVALCAGCNPYASGPAPRLGDEFGNLNTDVKLEAERLFAESGIPSMSAAIVVGDEMVWAKGFGDQPDLSTVYMAGSIDKPFLATALLQMVDQGVLSLDDDINEYLPFEVRNPYAPDVPITLRMLATHRSGLVHDIPGMRYVDNDGSMLRWRFWNLNRRVSDLWYSLFTHSREETIQNIFIDSSSNESADLWVGPPGQIYQYSNTGFADLLGMAIEEAAGMPYQEIVRNNVIEPLEMSNTAYEAYVFPQDQLAVPYARFEDGYTPIPRTGLAASGKLRTTGPDLARFLMIHMNQGSLDGEKILSPEALNLMHNREIELSGFDFPSMDLHGQGLGWVLWGQDQQGHSGAVPGFFSQMVYQEDKGTPFGVVVMMNTGCSVVECDFEWFDDYFVAIRELLLKEAGEIAKEKDM